MINRLSRLDFVAIFLSFVCLLHCLATPVIILMLPYLNFGRDDVFHLVMAVTLLIFASVAFVRGYQRHRQKRVIVLGSLGVTLLFVGLFLSSDKMPIRLSPQASVTIMGSVFLIFAHYLNLRRMHPPHHLHCGPQIQVQHKEVNDQIACSKALP